MQGFRHVLGSTVPQSVLQHVVGYARLRLHVVQHCITKCMTKCMAGNSKHKAHGRNKPNYYKKNTALCYCAVQDAQCSTCVVVVLLQAKQLLV